VLGLRAGTLEVGAPADLVLIDPDRVWKVESATLVSRSKNSAFLGQELRGAAIRTYVAGELVYEADGDATR
jgi:dihydroorotase